MPRRVKWERNAKSMANKCAGSNQAKGRFKNLYFYRGVKLLERAMKIVERGMERRIRELVNIDSMQFDFMSGIRTTDALFVVRRMQEEYRDKKKKLYCFVDIERAFDSVPRKVME